MTEQPWEPPLLAKAANAMKICSRCGCEISDMGYGKPVICGNCADDLADEVEAEAAGLAAQADSEREAFENWQSQQIDGAYR